MSKGSFTSCFVRVLSLGLVLGTCLAVTVHADDQNQRRKRQQQQQQQPQQPVYRPNAFVPQRYPTQPQQRPYVQQPRFPATQFQSAPPRTVINPNVPTYRAPVANPNVPTYHAPIVNPNAPSRFSKGPNDFRAVPNPQGQTFRQAPMIMPGTAPGRMPMPVTPMPIMPGRVVPISGTQDTGQSTLTRREVLSSPEDREFRRSLTAQQRQALDQLTPAQIQSLQQSGQWSAAKQAILAGRSPTPGMQNSAIPNPNGSGSSGPSGPPCPGSCPPGGSQTPGRTNQNGAAPPPTGGPAGNSGATNSGTGNANASGISPNDMGPTAGAADMAPSPGGGTTAGAPVGPPPQSPAALTISGFPSSFTASGGGVFQPTIPLSGSGFTTVTQIVWTCVMPSGQQCTGTPVTWTPANWSTKYVVYSDTSAMVAPHLLAGGDPTGVYQWTVSFVGNDGKSFVFQVNNAGAGSPPPPPPPPAPPPQPTPVPPPPSPPPAPTPPPTQTNNLPPCPSLAIGPSGLPSCTNGQYVFVPTANNYVEVFQNGQMVTTTPVATAQSQFGYVATSGGTSPTPPPPAPTPPPPTPPSSPSYTFNLLSNGNVEIYQNGQRISTGTAQYAAQFGYHGPGWDGQTTNNNQPAPPIPAPTPQPTPTALQVYGIGSYSTSSAPFTQPIGLSGSGLNAITEIRWSWTTPSGQSGSSDWNQTNGFLGKFSRNSDSSATVTPTLVAANDPAGTFQWTVTFFTGNQQVSRNFSVNYQPSPPPSYACPTWGCNGNGGTPPGTPVAAPTPTPMPNPPTGFPGGSQNPFPTPGTGTAGTTPPYALPTPPKPFVPTAVQIEVAKEDWIYAAMSNDVYHDPSCEIELPPGWTDTLTQHGFISGFDADAYVLQEGGRIVQVVLAFRGTQPGDPRDWVFGNGLFLSNVQNIAAENFVTKVLGVYGGISGITFKLTGHSLGAMLAKEVSANLGYEAIVFDPSFLEPPPTNGQTASSLSNVYTIGESGEILAYFQSYRSRNTTEFDFINGSPLAKHSICQLANGMKEVANKFGN